MRPRRLASPTVVAIVALVVLGGPLPRAQESPAIHYGMNTHYVDARMADKMRELGAGIVRIDFNWIGMQPRAGSRGYDFEATDLYVRSARRRGLDVFASVGYSPKWANGGRSEHAPPLRIQDWEDFVATVVERYQGRDMDVRYFGIWNEPDLHAFFEGSLDDYIALAKTGRQAIRRANGQAKVLGPEVNDRGVVNGYYAAAMKAVGDQFDIVTVHWYPTDRGSRNLETFLDDYVRPSAMGKPVWLTEVGQTACGRGGEEGQANLYAHVLDAFQARRSWLNGIFFYDLYEPTSKCSYPPVRVDWSNRPAFQVYKDAIARNP
jgi:O-glycosyl hydrolase